MKKGIKITLYAAVLLALLFALIVIFRMNEGKRRQISCVGVKVEFADDYRFVTKEDVEGYLKKDYGTYLGQRLDSVDLEKVEKILANRSAILKAVAYTTPDGYLNVKIWQRKPVIRFQKGQMGFYADEKGFLFPLQDNYTSQVTIIDGEVPLDFTAGFKGQPKTEREQKWLSGVIELANFITSSSKWNDFISQITVNSDGDLVMVPRKGRERFIFGKPVDIEKKFDRIEEYYTAILPAKGAYGSVNVKFNGQIVCREKI